MVYTSEQEVIALVDAFHRRTLSPAKWDHSVQLTVTLYYGLKFPYGVAFDLLRKGMRWVSQESNCSEGQRDTAIHFWLQTVKAFAIKYRNIDDLSALANILIAVHKESEMPYTFYERETQFVRDSVQAITLRDSATLEVPAKAFAAIA